MANTSSLNRPGSNAKGKKSNSRLLVVVDESPASRSAVEYVARVLGRRRGFHLCLAHFLPPLPPRLREFGGAGNPVEERRQEAEMRAEQQQWILAARKQLAKQLAARKQAEPMLNWARTRLRKAGLPACSLSILFSDPTSEQNSASAEILDLARRRKCSTIVVGRRFVSWFHRITTATDLAEKLVQEGEHLTLWVVE
jgi:nucleotide-binding universal stress UspA family protein